MRPARPVFVAAAVDQAEVPSNAGVHVGMDAAVHA